MKLGFFIFLMLISVNLFAAPENLKYGCETKVRWVQIDNNGDYRISVKPHFGYYQDKGWVESRFNFYNTFSDTHNGIIKTNVERAVIGYQLDLTGDTACYLELGRMKMDDLFSSKLQYNSMYNGVHFCIHKDKFKLHGGPFVSNADKQYLGAVGEVTFEEIKDLPISLTYSMTNWYPDADYIISQLTVKYHLKNIEGYPITAYAAFLRNHYADKSANGFYLGATLGKIEKAKDYEVDINYQYCELGAVHLIDRAGISTIVKSGMEVKVRYALTTLFDVQGKFLIADIPAAEISAIFKF